MAIKLLVVDDEAYLTQLVAHTLRKAGHTVMIAGDGEEAFALACRELPDLIVSDYQMPLLDGFELAIRLKQTISTAAIPIIMLTARGHRLNPTELARTNIRELLAKPFSARQLHARIDEVLATLTQAAGAFQESPSGVR